MCSSTSYCTWPFSLYFLFEHHCDARLTNKTPFMVYILSLIILFEKLMSNGLKNIFKQSLLIVFMVTVILHQMYLNLEVFSSLVFWWDSCCLVFSFLCCLLYTYIFCLSFSFLTMSLLKLFSIYEFECPSGIFRPTFRRILKKIFQSVSRFLL